MEVLIDNLTGVGILLGIALGGAFLAWLLVLLAERLLKQRIANGEVDWKPIRRPWILTVTAVLVHSSLGYTVRWFADGTHEIVYRALIVIAIIGLGWLIIMVTDAAGHVLSSKWDISKEDNRKERAMVTKFRVLRRVWIGLVALVTIGAILYTFPSIRSIGAGLLASAGVAGIVLGMALRPTVETFLASIQVALTEPISIDDVLIVEGEWGRVEEIRPTYVVVRIWDDRRLIVPLTHFIQQPFQNWTRTKAEITGVVTLKLDFKTPIEKAREQVKQFVEEDENYDGRFWNVQITDADDKAMTLRVLCTAGDASKAWDLRCAVREKMISWLQAEHPGALPRLRAEIDRPENAGEDA
jgi:small-conductance mechanosensitive channel